MAKRFGEYGLGDSLMPIIQNLIKPPDSEVANDLSKKHPYYRRPGRGHNRDNCDACDEGGQLICCDRCPASFHLSCHDPPLNADELPDGEWWCHHCKMTTKNVKKRRAPTSKTYSLSQPSRTSQLSRKISEVDEDLAEINAKILESATTSGIGKSRRARDKEVPSFLKTVPTRPKSLSPEPSCSYKSEEKAVPLLEHAFSKLISAAKILNPREFQLPKEFCTVLPFPGTEKAKTNTRTRNKKVAHKRASYQLDAEGLVPRPAKVCFTCSKSCKNSPLISCDYCPLFFHKDCLNPPLTVLPTGKWMCPNHCENFIDEHLVKTFSATERLKLWNTFSAPIDHESIKLEFFRKINCKNPMFRVKRILPTKVNVIVPQAVEYHYENPPKLEPTIHDVLLCQKAAVQEEVKQVDDSNEFINHEIDDYLEALKIANRQLHNIENDVKLSFYSDLCQLTEFFQDIRTECEIPSQDNENAHTLDVHSEEVIEYRESEEVSALSTEAEEDITQNDDSIIEADDEDDGEGEGEVEYCAIEEEEIIVQGDQEEVGEVDELMNDEEGTEDIEFAEDTEDEVENIVEEDDTVEGEEDDVVEAEEYEEVGDEEEIEEYEVEEDGAIEYETVEYETVDYDSEVMAVENEEIIEEHTTDYEIIERDESSSNENQKQYDEINLLCDEVIDPEFEQLSDEADLSSESTKYLNETIENELDGLDDCVIKTLAFQRLQQIFKMNAKVVNRFQSRTIARDIQTSVESKPNRNMPLPSQLLNKEDVKRIVREFCCPEPGMEEYYVSGSGNTERRKIYPKRKPTAAGYTLSGDNSHIRARALITPLTNLLRDSRLFTASAYENTVSMRNRTMTIGCSAAADLNLFKYGYCKYVSEKHATIFYDNVSQVFELINYSEYGTEINGILYTCDYTVKKSTPHVPDEKEQKAKTYQMMKEIIEKRRKIALRKTANFMDDVRMLKPIKNKCNCIEQPSRNSAWEGSAIMIHGDILKIGCFAFVFINLTFGSCE